MKEKISIFLVLASAVLFLSSCSSGPVKVGGGSGDFGPFIMTIDGGMEWKEKVRVNEKTTIKSADILSLAIDPMDSKRLYLGTEKSGLIISKNQGENWEKTKLMAQKNYAIVIDPGNSDRIYASGVWEGRGKIFFTENGGQDWKEVYSEPADGTVVSALAMSAQDSSVLYAATSEGMIFKTVDGGKNWMNLHKAKGPVSKIAYDPMTDDVVYFMVFGSGLLRTRDRGKTFEDLNEKISASKFKTDVQSLAIDKTGSGNIFIGVNGAVLRSVDFGETWSGLNILETAKKFPVRSLAVNPRNSREIMFAAGLVLYKSIDGGNQWSTYQLNSSKFVQAIEYDRDQPGTIYAMFRSAK